LFVIYIYSYFQNQKQSKLNFVSITRDGWSSVKPE
jgi:hypothetical protein